MTCEVTANFTADFREQVAIQLQREGFLVPPSAPNRDVAIMWGNVRLRHIPRRPRTSVWSEELRRRPLDSETRAVVRRVCVASEKGKNLNPHLSRKHLTASFNDLLFNDWRVHHMHLGPRGGRRTGRTGALLFVLVTDDRLHLLDLGDHETFGEVRLMEIAYRNFPDALPLVHAPGLRPTGRCATGDERVAARAAGIHALVEIEDKVFFSAGGITTSGDNSRAVSAADRVLDELARLEAGIRAAPDRVADDIAAAGGVRPSALHLKILVGGCKLSLLEVNSGAKLELFEITFDR